jgi:tetratricopeptide (TPR) repeat protein
MEYQEYLYKSQQAAQLIQSGRLHESVDFLYQFFLSDISDINKINICTDLAAVYDRTGNTDEAIAWFDKGIALECIYSRYEVLEKKAQYLSQLGRSQDAVLIYEALIKEPFVSEEEKERMRKRIQMLLGKTMGQWK